MLYYIKMVNNFIQKFMILMSATLLIAACSQASPPIDKKGEFDPTKVKINLDDYTPERPKLSSNILISEHSLDGTFSRKPPPSFPPRAEKSGHCVYTLQVNKLGNVESIIAIKCSDDVFLKHSRRNILKWQFHPKKGDESLNIPFIYGPHKLSYRLFDEDGNLIPE